MDQKVAEIQYRHTKVVLEDNSDVRKCLIASRMGKMGWTSRLFLLDHSLENLLTVSVFEHSNFELNLEHLLFLSDANLHTDILPHF